MYVKLKFKLIPQDNKQFMRIYFGLTIKTMDWVWLKVKVIFPSPIRLCVLGKWTRLVSRCWQLWPATRHAQGCCVRVAYFVSVWRMRTLNPTSVGKHTTSINYTTTTPVSFVASFVGVVTKQTCVYLFIREITLISITWYRFFLLRINVYKSTETHLTVGHISS